MIFEVVFLPEATLDLWDLYLYITKHDSAMRADTMLDKLEERCSALSLNPHRGHTVPELSNVYVDGYREIHYKPYRIIFQIVGERVFVHAVLDGRRELQEILERRMLR